ncbi:Collagen adhesin precursor [Arcanobacterium haemolyticum]|uniref:LPXTG-motif cell wall anchor domain protein n=2 Tax=Arcanobacterium haemolyticum TaxID=28264 RepID=D7BPG9_ARCHD|nr:LPXTG-motif cell wall anchor domain protein [Arcanobacterium haemolyticum DSM 20595]SQH28433.1 Collagen adhesin precursor [Arcanobacterium haemolyticum]
MYPVSMAKEKLSFAPLMIALLSFLSLILSPITPSWASDGISGKDSFSLEHGEGKGQQLHEARSLRADSSSESTVKKIQCYIPEQDLTCSETKLQQLINEAANTPTVIELGATDTLLTKTLVIPSQADITLVNHPKAPWGTTDSRLTREDGFTGVLVRVEQGGKLTFSANDGGGEVIVASRGEWVKNTTKSVIEVQGEFVLNHGTITGARNMKETNEGAVTISGEGASFIMNGGKVTDNERDLSSNGPQYGAANVMVTKNATMVMNGGEISNGRTRTDQAYGETGGINVMDGGSLVLNDGKIINNKGGWAGGLQAWAWDWDLSKHPERALGQRAKITINGGLIDSNTSNFGGGGVGIFGNADVTMNGGTISRNSAPNGGGVNAMDLYVWGAESTWKEIPGDGKQSGLSTEQWTKISPGSFTMNGGKITGNRANRTGGGVNVVSNGVNLYGGEISDNYGGSQGGGVYVATATYTANLFNVVATKNEASHIGGGMWLCPTGNATINVTDGGAFFGNTAKNYGDEFAHDNYGSAGAYESYFARRMLGGGPVAYYLDGGQGHQRYDQANPGREQVYQDVPEKEKEAGKDYKKKLFQEGLIGESAQKDQDRASSWAKLTITRNKAYRGGGIGSNGNVNIGSKKALSTVAVEKKWRDGAGKPLDLQKIPSALFIQLQGRITTQGKESVFDIGRPVELNEKNNWSYKFSELPQSYLNEPIEYQVVEGQLENTGENSKLIPVKGYNAAYDVNVSQGEDGTKIYNIVVTNTQDVTELVVEKKWVSSDGGPVRGGLPGSIGVQLLADGRPVGDVVKVVPGDDGQWVYRFAGLPKVSSAGKVIAYSVRESAVPGYSSSVGKTEVTKTGYKVVVTNTQDVTELVVEKKWVSSDGGPVRGGLPGSIGVQLLADGRPVGDVVKVVPGDDGQWVYRFAGLPKVSSAGKVIAYSVRESAVPGYSSSVGKTEVTKTGYKVVVTNTQDVTPQQPVKPKKPETPQLSKTGVTVTAALLVALGMISSGVLFVMRRKNS